MYDNVTYTDIDHPRIPVSGPMYTYQGITLTEAMCVVADHRFFTTDGTGALWSDQEKVADSFAQATAAMDSLGWFGNHNGRTTTTICWDAIPQDKAAMVAMLTQAVATVPV
jgi:hypothetical protein